MAYTNTTVIFMVIAVVACVVGMAFVGTYCLNKTVDQSDR
jgi:hypothetical protein